MERISLRRNSHRLEAANRNRLHGALSACQVQLCSHNASDNAGFLLGPEENNFWSDHKSAKVNTIRTKTLLEKCDLAVVRFGDKYKQWNAAFDAGFCAALGTPYITLHDEDIIHPLKEVDASALAWATTPAQVVELLKYITTQE